MERQRMRWRVEVADCLSEHSASTQYLGFGGAARTRGASVDCRHKTRHEMVM